MKLADWLRQNGISARDFGGTIGVRSANTVYRYISGDQIPARNVMREIIRATGGAVMPNDFYLNECVRE